jgi:sigma-B regulation protein RsbU (phosphoserine phosphatase)
MYHLSCGEIWGGIRNCDEDLGSVDLTLSMYSFASDGSRGGDIYYLSLCDHNLLTRMIVADVVGHGESVSEISTYIYDAIKTHINNVVCQDLLSELNCVALEKGMDALTTMVVAAFYKSDGNLYFANAGHPAALFKRWDETNWLQLKLPKGVRNSALGISDEAVDSQSTIQVKRGDCLLLYSDGLIEANNKDEELFGVKRLKNC